MWKILQVGLSTYSSDDRFLVEHTRHLGNWALRIKNARKDDEGNQKKLSHLAYCALVPFVHEAFTPNSPNVC